MPVSGAPPRRAGPSLGRLPCAIVFLACVVGLAQTSPEADIDDRRVPACPFDRLVEFVRPGAFLEVEALRIRIRLPTRGVTVPRELHPHLFCNPPHPLPTHRAHR